MKTYEYYLKETGNVHSAYYVEAADALGVKYRVLKKHFMVELSFGDKSCYIINAATPLSTATGTTICKRKQLTNQILKAHNIPVPEQKILGSIRDAIEFYKERKDIVIKPIQQIGGKGVSILPRTSKEVQEDYKIAFAVSKGKSSKKVIGEEFCQGDNYRFLVLKDKVLAVARRMPAKVTGDGVHTIQKLIKLENKERKTKLLKPIIIDREVIQKLQQDNRTLQDIPAKKETVLLRYNCNLTTGGTTEECTKEVNDYYKQYAIKAAKCVDCELAGIDIIAKDITKKGSFAINEINYNPGLRLHYKVDKGEVIKVAYPIIKYIKDKYLK